MTDEEMAEEYVAKNAYLILDTNNAFVSSYISYLDGLKAGRPKWHKVADGDYPPCEKGNYTINVLTNYGDIAYYDYNENCWIVEPSSAEIDPPIAWCEIPKLFKEVEK